MLQTRHPDSDQDHNCPAAVDGLTIGQMLAETCLRYPQRPAFRCCHPPVCLTWQAVHESVTQLAAALVHHGFQRGDRFGVWLPNRIEWVLLQLATAKIGVVLVNIHPNYGAEELGYAIEQSQIKGLACTHHSGTRIYDDVLQQLWPELRSIRHGDLPNPRFPQLKLLLRVGGQHHQAMIGWDDLVRSGDSIAVQQLNSMAAQVHPDDPVNLQFTSGTTGKPKGALLSHRNLLLNAFYAGQCQRMTQHDVICVPVPLYHCFGCVLGSLCGTIVGAQMVFPSEYFDAEAVLTAIDQHHCTAVYGVPTMFISLLQHPKFAEFDTSSLRTGIMAGSPCPIELMKRVTREMGAHQITIAYGQTEASPLITMTRTDDPIELRVGTVGRLIPGVQAKIIDPDNGRILADEQSGELCARGHNVMLGYFRDPDATLRAIDADGWLHTGDLAMRRRDGYFRITGRLKDLIIRGGENIAPREIEELLFQIPDVQDAQVVGVPDARYGEQVLAVVRRRDGSQLDEQSVRQFCASHLARFKVPRYVWFVDQFPTTLTGKVQKYKLRQQAIEHFGLQQAAAIPTA